MPLKKRMEIYIEMAESSVPIKNISHLAKTFNVSNRQLLRVLNTLCAEGVLEHSRKGSYRIAGKKTAGDMA